MRANEGAHLELLDAATLNRQEHRERDRGPRRGQAARLAMLLALQWLLCHGRCVRARRGQSTIVSTIVSTATIAAEATF